MGCGIKMSVDASFRLCFNIAMPYMVKVVGEKGVKLGKVIKQKCRTSSSKQLRNADYPGKEGIYLPP